MEQQDIQKLKLLVNLTDEDIKHYRDKYPHLNAFDIHTEGKKACDWALEHFVSDVPAYFSRWLARTEEKKIRKASY